MRRFGIRIENPIFDTMIAAWVLDAESNAFSLGSLSERILGTSGLQYEDVVPKGKTFLRFRFRRLSGTRLKMPTSPCASTSISMANSNVQIFPKSFTI